MEDDINTVDVTTASAARVKELVQRYGKTYVSGELSQERGACITGSAISAIMGENRWETQDDVFFEKVFKMSKPETPAMLHGSVNEPKAIMAFRAHFVGCKTFFVGFMRSDKYPFIGGTPDMLAIMPDGEGVLIEIKCPANRSIGDYVPTCYIGQVQTYLEICGLEQALFVQYKPQYETPKKKLLRETKLMVTRVQRDPDYLGKRMCIAWRFWIRLVSFKQAVLPTAPAAATAIKSLWKWHKMHTNKTKIKWLLCLSSFLYENSCRKGLTEMITANMN
jgi:putative phage-type endonuclease